MALLFLLLTLLAVLCFLAALFGAYPRFNWLAAGLLFFALVPLIKLTAQVF